jgi:rubrerythrin
MKEFKNIDDILDFAINEEQAAVEFYSDLASTARTTGMKNVFEEFAKEEMSHKARLIKIKQEHIYDTPKETIADLKIGDYLVNVRPHPNMTYEEALVLAMKKEKAAFKLYMNLSEKAPSAELKQMFLSLAQEESKHKLRFEVEYDEYVMKEN